MICEITMESIKPMINEPCPFDELQSWNDESTSYAFISSIHIHGKIITALVTVRSRSPMQILWHVSVPYILVYRI